MASVARSVVRDVLRVKEGDPVLISAAEHTVDLATEVAMECFKVGADPAIFYQNDAQRDTAVAVKTRLGASGAFQRPIVTEITPAPTFYAAEEYHQRYLEKRGLASCHI